MVRLSIITALLMILSPSVTASALQRVDFPENAIPRIDRPGWTCAVGFRRSGERCERIALPANAALDVDGRGWHCLPEYAREGRACTRVRYPANAVLVSQTNWKCLKGFRRAGDRCARIVVPPNGDLTSHGQDWRCVDGYRKAGDGCVELSPRANGSARQLGTRPTAPCPRGLRRENARCSLFALPDNALYNEAGNGWICMIGYERQADACVRKADGASEPGDG